MKDQTRNVNGHKASRIAQILWNNDYAAQGGGLMDFWDKIGVSKRNQCRGILKDILKARDEEASESYKEVRAGS